MSRLSDSSVVQQFGSMAPVGQTRLLFSTMAYVLYQALREFGLKEAALTNAQVNTIRNKLMKSLRLPGPEGLRIQDPGTPSHPLEPYWLKETTTTLMIP